MKFYEDQHKLAAYLERHPDAEWGYKDFCIWRQGGTPDTFFTPSEAVAAGHTIRPVLRYGLPSHLQSEIHNPDNLTEEQICEGGKYRACVKQDRCNQYHEIHVKGKWVRAIEDPITKAGLYSDTYRLPATVPWPDWEREEVTKSFPTVEAMLDGLGTSKEVTDRLAELKEADAKDARIAELEKANSKLSIWKDDMITEYGKIERWFKETSAEVKRLEAQLAASPWRRMSEVPTEEDVDASGCVLAINTSGVICRTHIDRWEQESLASNLLAWLCAPKFYGWPDPLADLLKSHGIKATPELTAALNAWKGVEK